MVKGSRVRQWDAIRILCTFIIICYHISCEASFSGTEYIIPFYNTANGAWGAMMVSVFFMLSGSTLYYVYRSFENREQIMRFYKNRIRDIMLPFWITWFIFYIVKSVRVQDIAWGGGFDKLILSVIGVDGYMYYLGENYTLIGEWFFGAIVILYGIYPCVLWIFDNYRKLGTGLIFSVYIVIAFFNPFKMAAYRNIFTCIWSFWIGIILGGQCCRQKLNGYAAGLMGITCSLVVIFIKIPLPPELILPIGGVSFYVSIYFLYGQVLKKRDVKISDILYKGSFMTYLIHHQIIYQVFPVAFKYFKPSVFWIDILLFAVVVYIIGCVYYMIYSRSLIIFRHTAKRKLSAKGRSVDE